MPVVVGIGFWILKPEYIRLLYTDETGSKFLTYAICSEIVGILIIRKIASPKFLRSGTFAMLMSSLFFILMFATLAALTWSGIRLFENQEDPLGDRLEELQAH